MTRKPSIKSEQGQTMVEFAIVAPILLMLILGIIQLGVLFNNYITLTDAARAGARQAAVGRSLPAPESTTISKTQTSAANLASQSQANGQTCSNAIPPAASAKLCVFVCSESSGTCTAPSWAQGSDVTVKATYPYDFSIMGISFAAGMLSSQTTERVE